MILCSFIVFIMHAAFSMEYCTLEIIEACYISCIVSLENPLDILYWVAFSNFCYVTLDRHL